MKYGKNIQVLAQARRRQYLCTPKKHSTDIKRIPKKYSTDINRIPKKHSTDIKRISKKHNTDINTIPYKYYAYHFTRTADA